MPSTVVHVAFAGLVGAALLADHFDGKAVAVVMAAVAFVDLDVFVGFWVEGAHRAAFHTLLLPGLVAALVWLDTRGRALSWVQSRVGSGVRSDGGSRSWLRVSEHSRLRSRWGARGVRIAWVSVAAVTFAGIGLDTFFNGTNLLYPVHDRFYTFSGKVLYSTTDGFVQTLVTVNWDALIEQLRPETAGESGAGAGSGSESGSSKVVQPDEEQVRTTDNTHYRTGVDPSKGAEQENVERLFPIAMTGERALLALTGYVVVGLRIWEERRTE